MPKKAFRENGKVKVAKEMTKDENHQVKLYDNWRRTKEYKILKEYEGRDIEEVPEEYREKIAKLRSYGLGLKEENNKINAQDIGKTGFGADTVECDKANEIIKRIQQKDLGKD